MPATVSETSLAVSADEFAELLGISKRHLWSLNAQGKLPRPIRLGRSVRWRLDEIRDWLAAGAPDRDCWEETRK